jgi:hypothetical protein
MFNVLKIIQQNLSNVDCLMILYYLEKYERFITFYGAALISYPSNYRYLNKNFCRHF